MSAQLKDSAVPDDSKIYRVFDASGLQTTEFIAPEVTLRSDQVYGSITTSFNESVSKQLRTFLGFKSIALSFEKLTDGRPYSLALRLREIGYRGEIHAIGVINQEILHHMIRVGFTHFHLEFSQPISKEILHPFSYEYQRLLSV